MNDLSEIASVAGKGGLYRVLKPGRSGLVLESFDEKKTRFISTPNHRVSVLNEVSIFTTSSEGSVLLQDVFRKIYKDRGNDTGVDIKSSPGELMEFLKSVVPDYDPERVYASDVKKLVSWYNIIAKEFPGFLKEEPKDETKEAVPSEHETIKTPEKKPVINKPLPVERARGKTNTKGAMQKSVSTPVKSGKKGA